MLRISWESKTWGLELWGYPGLHSNTLSWNKYYGELQECSQLRHQWLSQWVPPVPRSWPCAFRTFSLCHVPSVWLLCFHFGQANVYSQKSYVPVKKMRSWVWMAKHSCNLSTQEAKAGGSWVWGQPKLHRYPVSKAQACDPPSTGGSGILGYPKLHEEY